MNAIINNNRKDDIKKENVEIDDVDHSCIGDGYKDLMGNILKPRLRGGDLHLIKFDNGKFTLTNIANNCLEKNRY